MQEIWWGIPEPPRGRAPGKPQRSLTAIELQCDTEPTTTIGAAMTRIGHFGWGLWR